jgi:uncharacterized protein (TIGR03435 family)
MSMMTFWNESWTAALVNHLWQSTVVAALALLLTAALSKNQARIRYWIWLAASAKFLLPFSLLIDAGHWMRPMIPAPLERVSVASAFEQAAQPFQPAQTLAVAGVTTTAHSAEWWPALLLSIWICGVVLIAARWVSAWMRVRSVVNAATPTEIPAGVPVLRSTSLIEPGVFGIFRPVMLLPAGILQRLQPAQLRAIVVHEMCHVRRRDNLTFALHMIAQALFWFHPLTWWIGARLVEEREHACDEAVLESGGEAEIYAEGILNVCKFYVESPLACASGVSGSNLKARIARIMSAPMAHKLNLTRKLLLATAGVAAFVLPFSLGLVRTVLAEERAEDAAAKLPKIDVASIKPHKDDVSMGMMRMRLGMQMLPDGVSISGLPLDKLLQMSFGLPENRILNEPGWTKSERFDIEAKVDPADAPKMKDLTRNERGAMMVPLLQDRFGLKFHRETRVMEVYTLIVAKGGSKMKPAQSDAPAGNSGMGRAMMRMSMEGMSLEGSGATTEQLANVIALQLGSTVVDKTGLTGKYDYTLKFAPEHGMAMGMPPPPGPGAPAAGDPAPASAEPSLFTAVQEQLGLKLVSQKEPVEVVVIDQIQRPSPN